MFTIFCASQLKKNENNGIELKDILKILIQRLGELGYLLPESVKVKIIEKNLKEKDE
jgi:hypothetical protein